MKRALSAFVLAIFASFGCAGSRPPPQSCEMPPKQEEKKVEIGTCPVDEPPRDAGPDATGDAP